MIIIRTTCKHCGEILIRSVDIHLHLGTNETRNYYEFKCPQCGEKGSGEADKQFVEILVSNGVKLDEPAVINSQCVQGDELLSWDDYLDFKLALRGSQIYKELKRLCESNH